MFGTHNVADTNHNALTITRKLVRIIDTYCILDQQIDQQNWFLPLMVIKITGFPADNVKLGTWQVQCCACTVGKMRSVQKKSEFK